ncbi:MAG: sulfite exporter TauE/SafE family protein [Alphaproteobacteria bacterium]|nr:sulfite exporter TauE/SafE family protein [Alphaproteobacteria bacterium]
MTIYLPIADMSVDVFLLLAMGAAVGFLSGLFGVGGGFLTTPLLMFIGIPPAVAVGTGVNQVVAASVSGVLAHMRQRNVDFKMGAVLTAGGLVGSVAGVGLFTWLRTIGQVDLMVTLSYVLFLGGIGAMMAWESGRTILRRRRGLAQRGKLHQHTWLHGLPFKTRFRRSRLYISALLPLAIGLVVGVLAAIMGVGGGFIMVPAMVYLLGMPTAIVIGTSLLQIVFVTAAVTFMQSVGNQTVDVVLALLLLAGAVVGAQLGSRAGTLLRGEQLRGLLALLVLAVCIKLGWDLVAIPRDLFSIGAVVLQ